MTRDNLTFEEDVIDRLARIETNALVVADHEARIRTVEKRQTFQLGQVSVIAAIIGLASGWLSTHLHMIFG